MAGWMGANVLAIVLGYTPLSPFGGRGPLSWGGWGGGRLGMATTESQVLAVVH